MPIYICDARYSGARDALKEFLMDRFELRAMTLDTRHGRLQVYIPRMGYITLAQMPGQCGILIAHNLPASTKAIVEITETIARIFQYKTLMISHRVGAQSLACWLDAGYQPIWENNNIHSGYDIMVLAKDLGEQPDEFKALAALIYDCG